MLCARCVRPAQGIRPRRCLHQLPDFVQSLADFEADLHQHIHLENNILFPRAIAMEPGHREERRGMAARAARIETQAGRALTPGEIFEITRAQGDQPVSLAHALHRRPVWCHAAAGNILSVCNLLAVSSHHAAGFGLCRDGSRRRPRADLRLGRHIHPRYRLLFHSQVPEDEVSSRSRGCIGRARRYRPPACDCAG